MKIAKGILWLTALMLVAYAIGVLVDPVGLIGGSGVQMPTPQAIADGRATYGGCVLGLGLFLIFSAVNNARVSAGLWLMVFSLGGFAAGRTLAVLIDPAAGTPLTLGLIAYETFLAVLGVIGLRLLPKTYLATTSTRAAGTI